MRKIPVLFLLPVLVLFYSSCKKSGADLPEVKATLLKAAPASDGPPRDELYLDETKELVIPLNKLGAWPQTGGPVVVRFVDTGKTYAVGTMSGAVLQLRVVYLVTFRPL